MNLAPLLAITAIFASGWIPAQADASQDIENATWATPPNALITSQLMPAFAATIGVSGSVELRCLVLTDGPLHQCQVVEETTPGLGFGAAARLVSTTGQMRAKRIDGTTVATTIRFRVRFAAPGIENRGRSWSGPEPTPERLRLARSIAEVLPDEVGYQSEVLDGLDFDRRAVVGTWVAELLDMSEERRIAVRTVQLARLFDETELQGMLGGRRPREPSPQEWLDACPEQTPEERAAIGELRARYCAMYECGSQ